MGQSRRIIWSCNLVTDFLDRILYHEETPSKIIVVCSTREHFLEQLAATTRSPADGMRAPEDHKLLTKAIGLLSQSRNIKLVFCATLEHLRAYMSVVDMTSSKRQDTTCIPEKSSQQPLLAVLNFLALHQPTSEFSAQGLSRTLAAAAEVTARQEMDLVLCECVDAMDGAIHERGEASWHTEVPLLSRTTQIGGEENTSKGPSIRVRMVAERWFEFDDDSRNICT